MADQGGTKGGVLVVGKYDIDLSMHKCGHCGLYYPGYQIDSHEKSCHMNPDNQAKVNSGD